MNSPARQFIRRINLLAALCILSFSAHSQTAPPRRVTNTPEHSLNLNPTISGDGRHVAFESTANLVGASAAVGFRTLRADISGATPRFTQVAASRAPVPAISQDGSRVAFASRDDLLPGMNVDGNFEIFFFDGVALRQLTQTTPGDDSRRATDGNFQPSLSDDGRWLAFHSNRDLMTGANTDGNLEIFLFDAVGQTFNQLTNSVGDTGSRDAKLSGDATRLAFIRDGGTLTGGDSETLDLLLLEIQTSTPPRVIADDLSGLSLTYGRAISDDGSRVVFAAVEAGASQIFLFDNRNNVVRRLTSLRPLARDVSLQPTISGDGSRITFATRRRDVISGGGADGGVELYLYDIPTRSFSPVTDAPAAAVAEVVSSLNDDGSLVAFNFPRVLATPIEATEFVNNSEIFVAQLAPRAPFSTSLRAIHAATFGKEPAIDKTLAPGQLAFVQGTNLALLTAQTARNSDGTFPVAVSGTQLFVNGRPAQLLYVSPTQINFSVPPETELGEAQIVARNHDGYESRMNVAIMPSAPGVFTEIGDGSGAAIALDAETFFRSPFDPVDAQNNVRRLSIFSTGVRFASQVEVLINNQALTVETMAPSPDLPGLDEIHVVLSRALTGAGVVSLIVRADGRESNPTTIHFTGTRRPASISLAPSVARVGVGRVVRFTAAVLDADGRAIPDAPVLYQSSAPGIAAIDTGGLARGLSAGAAEITATAGEATARAVLEVFSLTLVLNEVLADPPDGTAGDANVDGVRSASQDELIEIVNHSQNDLPLDGYQILTGGSSGNSVVRHTFAAGTLLLPGTAVIVFGGGEAAFDPGHPIFAGALVLKASTGGLSLVNGGGQVSLRDPAGVEVERLTYGEGTNLRGDRNQSLTRSPDIFGDFTLHQSLPELNRRLFSPGTHTDGRPFALSVPLSSIVIEPSSAAIITGGQQQFAARAFDPDGRELSGVIFSWQSSAPAFATIDRHGLAQGVAPGLSLITATARGVQSSNATLEVRQPLSVVTRIELSPAQAAIVVGNQQIFTARAFDQFDRLMTGVALTFASSQPQIADVSVVNVEPTTGVVTASVRGLAPGNTSLTASAAGADNLPVTSNAALLQVNAPAPLISRIEISPSALNLNRGSSQRLSARAFDQSGQEVPAVVFNWSSANPQIVAVDGNGVCRAVGIGTAAISATTPDGRGGVVSTQAAVSSIVPLVVNEILADVAPDNATTPAIEGDANRDGTRSADDDEFVELLNNSSAPLDLSGIVLADGTSNRFTFLAGTMLAAGRAVIVFGGGAPPTGDAAFGNALIHLATSLGLNDGGDTLTVKLPQSGSDVIIATQPFGSGGSGAPPAPADQSLTRAPDAEINLAGGGFVPHAAASNSAGRIFSPGTRLDGTPFGSSPLSRIEIVPAQATIEINATQSFNARAFAVVNGTESEVSFVSFRWEASDQNKAALVPPTGTTTVATALAAGTVTISARAGGLQANATLNINPPPPILTSVQLTPLTASIVAGNTQQFTARALDQNNQEFRGAIFSFTSSDTSVATIDAVTTASDGSTAIATVTGGNAGAAQINANAASGSTSVQSNAAMLNVTAAPMLTRIEVTPAEAFVSLAASRHFTARAFDQNNQELSGVTFNWTTTDESIASVDQAGLATGLRTGQTTLRAASGQVSSNPASLQVTAPAIPTAGQVSINEALISFSTSTTQTRADFLELYNPTEHTLDISGLVISYRPGGSGNTPRTVTLPGSIGSAITLIRPRAFFLVINGGQTFGVSITTINGFADGFDASTFNSQTNYFDLNNTTGGIRIELNGVKLDGLTYQGGSAAPAPPFNAYGEGALFSFTSGTTNDLIRSPASADTDANAADFRRNGSTASVTPKAANP